MKKKRKLGGNSPKPTGKKVNTNEQKSKLNMIISKHHWAVIYI